MEVSPVETEYEASHCEHIIKLLPHYRNLSVGEDVARGSLCKLTDTTVALNFHVDPVIDQNTPVSVTAGERACHRRCAVQTGRRERARRCGAEVLSRCVLMESHLGRLVPCVLSLYLFIHLCQAAPGLPGTQREESVNVHPAAVALANPFGTRDDDHRLLKSYIQSSLKEGQGGPEISTWEQEVFFLFRLYDYDRIQVVSMVDFLLQTQDLNQDGLLAPSELLSPSLPHTQDSSNNNAPHQKQEVAAEEKLSNPSTHEGKAGTAEHREENEKVQPDEEEQSQQEVKTEEEELINQVDEQHGQQIPEAPAAEQEQDHKVPVHQGQPEM
ncbi:hypothetical protein FQN60_010786 [Etheostoma spectabile]|uniref:EF-hand domain-containing protein n=1 Tax=Etheostoma spectabile TaxID=54343 RepID=A0A5J5DQ69_9PERO|nr:hypothetical protein FQN60_010786 [Etheostoma spectabile]